MPRLCCLVLALTFSVGALRGEDWPHWRGARRSGVVAEDSGWAAKTWPPKEPTWTAHVGEGSTSPLVVAGKVYTMGWADGQDTVCCLALADGKELWRVSYRSPRYGRHHLGDEVIYSGVSSTPAFDVASGHLYTLGTDGDLLCWDGGRKVWGLNLYEQYKVGRRPKVGRQGHRDYGYTSSPLVFGDVLLVEVGARQGTLIAFDRKTGRQRWVSECVDPAGHNAGPVPITVEGVPCVALLTIHRLVVIRLDKGHEGKTIAEYPWETDFANNIAAPAVHDDCVLITSAYNKAAICKVKITLQGAKKLWEAPYSTKVCTPVIHEGHVYWAWRTLKCLDWETGKLKWEGANFGDPGSCLVTSDNRLIVWGARGKLTLAETASRSPGRYTELSSVDRLFRTEAWPHVVLSGGRLLCKDRLGNLNCYKMSP